MSVSLLYTLSPQRKSTCSLSKRNRSISWNEISIRTGEQECTWPDFVVPENTLYTRRVNIRNSNGEGSSKGDFQRIMDHKINFKKDLGEKSKTKNLCVKRLWIYMYCWRTHLWTVHFLVTAVSCRWQELWN